MKTYKIIRNPGFAEYRSPWATQCCPVGAVCRLFHDEVGEVYWLFSMFHNARQAVAMRISYSQGHRV